MKRWVLLAVLISVIALVVGAVAGWRHLTSQPLYRPGMVRQQQNLEAPLSPPPQPPGAGRWLMQPGIELAHFAAGEGRNVLVIHGGPGMPFTQAISGLEPLTGRYHFHYYDQRGSGASTRPFDRFTSSNTFENMQQLERALGLGAQIADIERIRHILGEDRLILIGHSWGGLLASLYAAEFPQHVEALILVAPANVLVLPQPDPESDLFASVASRLSLEEQQAFEAFMAEYMDFGSLFAKSEEQLVEMNTRFGEFYAQTIDFPPLVQGRPGGWMVWAQYLSMGQRHDYRAALATVSAPVLVLHGADDLQSEPATRLYAEAIPQAEFVVIEDAGHFMFADQPEAFAAAVDDFLSGLP